MSQLGILPIKLMYEEPYSGNSSDLRSIGYTPNKIRYALKREKDAPLLPLSEWIGYKLSEFCNILTPDYDIVECIDGDLAFGSRWEEGSTDIYSQPFPLNFIIDNSPTISQTHALDIFYGNIDRHAGNFLTAYRSNEKVLLAMDFSRAGPIAETPFGPQPLPFGCNTIALASFMSNPANKYFDEKKYDDCKKTLKTITKRDFEIMIEPVPDQWFSSISKQDILEWWDNKLDFRKFVL